MKTITNNESKNIWTKPRNGARGALLGLAMIFLAAALLAAGATALAYLIVPNDAHLLAGATGVWTCQTPAMIPAVIALQAMGVCLALAVPAIGIHRGVKWLMRRAARRSRRTLSMLPKTSVGTALLRVP